MSEGAFRDGSAAVERAVALQQRNEELEAELLELRGVASEAARELKGETLTSVRGELKATLSKLTAATRDLQAVQENYRALRRERDELAENVGLEKARADKLHTQLESLRNERAGGKERTLMQLIRDAERENSREKAKIKILDDQVVELKLLLQQAIAQRDERRAQEDERLANARAEVPENYQAFLSRLEEERQELLVEVKELRAKLEARGRR